MNPVVMAYLAHVLRGEGFAARRAGLPTIRDPLDAHLTRVAKPRGAARRAQGASGRASLGGVHRHALPATFRRTARRARVLIGSPVARECRAAAKPGRARRGELMMGQSLAVWRQPVDVSVDSRFRGRRHRRTRPLGLGAVVMRLAAANDGVVCVDETDSRRCATISSSDGPHPDAGVSARRASDCELLRTGAFRR